MSGPEVESAFKVVVKGGATRLTVARIQEALNTLHAKGVPDWADVEVNRQPGRESTGWAVVAKWDPDQAPPKTEIHIDVHPGVLDPELVARRIQRESGGFRKIKDNPQA